MNRREFMLRSAAAATALWPPALHAQRAGRIPRLGVLLYGNPQTDPNIASFRRGLSELGYADGKNIAIEYRYADGKPERLPALGTDLVESKADAILVFGGDVVVHVQTRTIPLVFTISSDPVKSGLVASLGKPGGNATGFTFLQDQLAAKRLVLLKEAVPRVSRVGFLFNPMHLDNELQDAEQAASATGVQLHVAEISEAGDFEPAFEKVVRFDAEALYVVSSRQMVSNIARIVEFGQKAKIPVVGGWGEWAQRGALISYGPNVIEISKQAAVYVDRILKGANPADLPVQQPTRFELVVNLKTAKELGFKIRESFLLQADKVIE